MAAPIDATEGDSMPEVYLKGTPDTHARSEFRRLGPALPQIVADACNSTPSFGPMGRDEILPDTLHPFRLIVPGVTPDLKLTVEPHYSEARHVNRDLFRTHLINALNDWLRKNWHGRKPSLDVDVDFIWGCGAHVRSDGFVGSTWPN